MQDKFIELVSKRQSWVEANQINGFDAGLKRLLTELYPDNAHFIYELLQNAEDADAKEVTFLLYDDHIEFEHDGDRLFSIEDVEAITSIGFSTKRDDNTRIGKFGVGFKAVFAYTSTPTIESGDYHFKITDMVVPEMLVVSTKNTNKTRFIFPFDNPGKSKEKANEEIEKLLRSLDATALLFLSNIRKVEYILPDGSLGYIERVEISPNHVQIRIQRPGEVEVSEANFLRFNKVVSVVDSEQQYEGDKTIKCRISVAFGIGEVTRKLDKAEQKTENDQKLRELIPIEPGKVCIYFPANKETSNLRFHLHAPFASTVARDSVRDCASNHELRDHLVELVAESVHTIRDYGLLNVAALSVLPNDKDNLPSFYKPFIERLISEFSTKDLVPMKTGGHAPSERTLRGLRRITDLIDDDDMTVLLTEKYSPPIWIANPPQLNQRSDNFISMLAIRQWGDEQLVETLRTLDNQRLTNWLKGKDDSWHRKLYELLNGYIDAAPKAHAWQIEQREQKIASLPIIRCADGIYRKGNECFFGHAEKETDGRFPRIAKGIYTEGSEGNEKLRLFLISIGIREVDEKVEIEYFLHTHYSQEAVDLKNFKPNIEDIIRFVEFLNKYPSEAELFKQHFILKNEMGTWSKPTDIYLDTPYKNTGLREYYGILEEQSPKNMLSNDYANFKERTNEITIFAEKIGALVILDIERRKVSENHPDWPRFDKLGGIVVNQFGTNSDFSVTALKCFLSVCTLKKSKLVWRTMRDGDTDRKLHAFFGRNGSYSEYGASSLVHDLRTSRWVPQSIGQNIIFVKPGDAFPEKLPDGFEYQTGWKWIQEIEFAKHAEILREATKLEEEKRTAEYKQKTESASVLGFDSAEKGIEAAKLQKDNPDGYRKLMEETYTPKATFPTRSTVNPERRQEKLEQDFDEAPAKQYEKRERSVRVTASAIDKETWLRNMYTNDSNEMICQICKDEMPFRKRNGEHYFEAVEALSKEYFKKEHEAQHLALCPLCSAKYKEFVKGEKDALATLKKELQEAADNEVPLSLGNEKTTLRFVEIHMRDIKQILGTR